MNSFQPTKIALTDGTASTTQWRTMEALKPMDTIKNNGKKIFDLDKLLSEGLFSRGQRDICPCCGHETFSLKKDRSLAKCFHPFCGAFARPGYNGQAETGFNIGFYDVMDEFYNIARSELLSQKDVNGQSAYAYLVSRHILPEVIDDFSLGAVPANDSWKEIINGKFDSEIKQIDGELKTLLSKQNDSTIKEIDETTKMKEFLINARDSFSNTFKPGQLLFFYRDIYHRIVSIKARTPYESTTSCRWFKPFKTKQGFFGHDVFSPNSEWGNEMILMEGEFNALQLQSLAKRAGKGYVNCASFGGACGNWQEELKKTKWKPIFALDNDPAGKSIIERTRPFLSLHAFTVPGQEGADMDSYICSMEPWTSDERTLEKWHKVKTLIYSAKEYFWEPKINDFLKTDKSGKQKVDYSAIGEHFAEKYHCFTSAGNLYVYRNGCYSRNSEFLPTEIQTLLGKYTSNYLIDEISSYIKRKRILQPDELDPESKRFINVKNGMLNWMDMALLPHDPKYLSTMQIPVEFNFNAYCPEIRNFLNSIFPENPDNRALLEEIAGVSLISHTDFEKWFLLTGTGGNGKSTYLDLLTQFIGQENISNIPAQAICGEDKFALSRLHGKLLNIYDDLDSNSLQKPGALKTITSGKPISAQEKFKPIFEFRPFCRLLFACNELPGTQDKSQAFWRRVIVIPFNQRFAGKSRKEGLIDTLTTPDELSGFLNIALRGLHRAIENRGFSENHETNQALRDYKSDADPVQSFINDECILEGNYKTIKQNLYEAFTTYCENSLGLKHILGRNKFYRRLMEGWNIKTASSNERIDMQQTFVGIAFNGNSRLMKAGNSYA